MVSGLLIIAVAAYLGLVGALLITLIDYSDLLNTIFIIPLVNFMELAGANNRGIAALLNFLTHQHLFVGGVMIFLSLILLWTTIRSILKRPAMYR